MELSGCICTPASTDSHDAKLSHISTQGTKVLTEGEEGRDTGHINEPNKVPNNRNVIWVKSVSSITQISPKQWALYN